MFLCDCLQHDEEQRIDDPINHPYITKDFDVQYKLTPKLISYIFPETNQDESQMFLEFDTKDAQQMKRIHKAYEKKKDK